VYTSYTDFVRSMQMMLVNERFSRDSIWLIRLRCILIPNLLSMLLFIGN
jgi:hypothetical protein